MHAPITGGAWKRRVRRKRKWNRGLGGWGGDGQLAFNGDRVSLWEDDMFWRQADGCPTG